jgi:integrase/recombinase XerD
MKIKDTFEGYLEYQRQRGMDSKTIDANRLLLYGSLSHSIQDVDVESLRVIDAARVIEAGKAHGEYGPQRSITVLRKLLRYLKDSGHEVPIDWRDIDVPHVPRKHNEYLTKEELEKVLEAFDVNTLPGLRTRALCEVLFASGMRISEALSLDKADIDWEKYEAVIVNAKTKDQETVRFSPRSFEWLKRYIAARTDDMPFLFVSGKGRMPTVTARWNLREHTRTLGIKKHIKNHIFRKSFVTHLIQGGADIIAVQDLARHQSPRTTLRYYAVANKERSKEVHADIMNDTLSRVGDPAIKADGLPVNIKK